MFFQVVFGGLGCPGQKTTFVQGFVCLAAFDGKANKARIS